MGSPSSIGPITPRAYLGGRALYDEDIERVAENIAGADRHLDGRIMLPRVIQNADGRSVRLSFWVRGKYGVHDDYVEGTVREDGTFQGRYDPKKTSELDAILWDSGAERMYRAGGGAVAGLIASAIIATLIAVACSGSEITLNGAFDMAANDGNTPNPTEDLRRPASDQDTASDADTPADADTTRDLSGAPTDLAISDDGGAPVDGGTPADGATPADLTPPVVPATVPPWLANGVPQLGAPNDLFVHFGGSTCYANYKNDFPGCIDFFEYKFGQAILNSELGRALYHNDPAYFSNTLKLDGFQNGVFPLMISGMPLPDEFKVAYQKGDPKATYTQLEIVQGQQHLWNVIRYTVNGGIVDKGVNIGVIDVTETRFGPNFTIGYIVQLRSQNLKTNDGKGCIGTWSHQDESPTNQCI